MIPGRSTRAHPLLARWAIGAALLAAGSLQAGTLELTLTNQAGGEPLAGAVVTVAGGQPPEPGAAVMSQKGRAFHPQVLTIARGSEVTFPNEDNIQHHVYSFSSTKTFDIELYADVPESPVGFEKAGIVEIGCNIHDHMQAFIVVVDTPHVGHSDSTGQVRMEVPDALLNKTGRLDLQVWHPRIRDKDSFQPRFISGSWPIQQSLALDIEPPQDSSSGGLGNLQKRFQDL